MGDKSRNSNAFVILESKVSLYSLDILFDIRDSDARHSKSLLSDALSAKSFAIICSVSSEYKNLCDERGPNLFSRAQ